MKKYTRQRLILDLIEQNEIKTQDELSELLQENGVHATQATISRDIKELRISKVQTDRGEYKYTIIDTVHDSMNERLQMIFRSAVLSIRKTDDMIIVQTIAYTASVCGLTIQNEKIKGIAGILTGLDTIFIKLEDDADMDAVINEIKGIMR